MCPEEFAYISQHTVYVRFVVNQVKGVSSVGRSSVLSLPDLSGFDKGTAVVNLLSFPYLTIEMSGINSMSDLPVIS